MGAAPRVDPPSPLELFFGRHSAPPGSFWKIFGSSEARLRCATFVLSRLPMVRPPAAAIHDLLFFLGLGVLGEISGLMFARLSAVIFFVFGLLIPGSSTRSGAVRK